MKGGGTENWCEKIMQFIADIKIDRTNYFIRQGNSKKVAKSLVKNEFSLEAEKSLGGRLSQFLKQVNINLVEIYGIDLLNSAGVPVINKELWDRMPLGYPETKDATKLDYTLKNCKILQNFLKNNPQMVPAKTSWPESPDYDAEQLGPGPDIKKSQIGGKRRRRK